MGIKLLYSVRINISESYYGCIKQLDYYVTFNQIMQHIEPKGVIYERYYYKKQL